MENSLNKFLLAIFGPFVSFFSLLLRLFLSSRRNNIKNKQYCRLPPGPTPWPFVGSLVTMICSKLPHFQWILRIAEGKDIACIRLGAIHTVIVNSPELARQFLKKHDASFASRPLTMATEHAGGGGGYLGVIFSPWGDQWKKMRRVVASHVLSSSKLKQQETLRHEEANHLVQYVYNQCKQQTTVVDVRLATRYYCGNIIRRMMFGRRWLRKEKEYSLNEGGALMAGINQEVEHVEAAFSVVSLVYSFRPSDYFMSTCLGWLDLDGHERMMKKAVAVINKFHDPIIHDRLENCKKINANEHDKDANDILDILISLKDNDGLTPLLTAEEIKALLAVSFLLFS